MVDLSGANDPSIPAALSLEIVSSRGVPFGAISKMFLARSASAIGQRTICGTTQPENRTRNSSNDLKRSTGRSGLEKAGIANPRTGHVLGTRRGAMVIVEPAH